MFIFCQGMATKCQYFVTIVSHNTTFFGPIGLKLFMGAQESIIYRLAMRYPSYDPYVSFLFHHARPSWSGASKPDQLSGPSGPTVVRYLEIMFSKLSEVQPPPHWKAGDILDHFVATLKHSNSGSLEELRPTISEKTQSEHCDDTMRH